MKRCRSEMAGAETVRAIELLATPSQHANFSVACRCELENPCHRSVRRGLLLERGARVVRLAMPAIWYP